MDNLSKENTWNAIEQESPIAFAHFMAWLDEYKKSVNWRGLFNGGINYNDYGHGLEIIEVNLCVTKAPKFHDLPMEMQIGIMMKYLEDSIPEAEAGFANLCKEMRNDMDDTFEFLNNRLEAKANGKN